MDDKIKIFKIYKDNDFFSTDSFIRRKFEKIIGTKNLLSLYACMHSDKKIKNARFIDAELIKDPRWDTWVAMASPFFRSHMNNFDYLALIEIASTLDDSKWEAAMRKASGVITDEMKGNECSALIRTASQLPDDQWEESVRRVRSSGLILLDNDGEGWSYLIEVSSRMTEEQWEEAIKKVRPSINSSMSGKQIAELIKIAAWMTTDQWMTTIVQPHQLKTKSLGGGDRSALMRVILNLPGEQWETTQSLARPLITERMGGDRMKLIEAASKMPPEQWQEAVEKATENELITEGMSGRDRVAVVEFVAPISSADLNKYVRRAQSFFTRGMSGGDRVALMKAVASKMDEHWDAIFATVNHYIENAQMMENMSGGDIVLLIEAAAKSENADHWKSSIDKVEDIKKRIKSPLTCKDQIMLIDLALTQTYEKWTRIIQQVETLFSEKLRSHDYVALLDFFSKFLFEQEQLSIAVEPERSQFWPFSTSYLSGLFSGKSSGFSDSELLSARVTKELLSFATVKAQRLFSTSMNSQDYIALINFAVDIFQKHKEADRQVAWNTMMTKAGVWIKSGMTGEDCVALLKVAENITVDKRAEIEMRAELLTTEDMSGADYAALLTISSKMSTEQWIQHVKSAHMLMTENMDILDRVALIEAASTREKIVWDELVDKAKLLITDAMDGEDCVEIIKAAEKMSLQEWNDAFRKIEPLLTKKMRAGGRIGLIEAAKNRSNAEWNMANERAKPFIYVPGVRI